MKLHTVFITYNRLELTKRAIKSYLETVTIPFTFSVVDNDSSDGTKEWVLLEMTKLHPHRSHLLSENHYPGYAANLGWSEAPNDATHLQRADNDFEFIPGWCGEVTRSFKQPNVGQLGLRTNKEEMRNRVNVGGNCIITREIWDKGLRYDERPWPQIAKEVGKGWSEDGLMSMEVKKMGYTWTRVKVPCIRALSLVDKDDPYYVKSLGDRGVTL